MVIENIKLSFIRKKQGKARINVSYVFDQSGAKNVYGYFL